MKILDLIKKIKRKSIELPRNIFLFKIGPIIRRFKKNHIPNKSDGKVLIHVGCGDVNDSKYINVDTRPGWHIHYVDLIENFEKLFPENYADLIYSCHVLEHVSHLKLLKTVKGIYKCLKNGGIFRISVPNFDVILEMYKESKSVEAIIPPLMGGQGYPGNFHRSVFNEDSLRNLLLKSGFREVHKWNPENAIYYNFKDWAKKNFPLNGKEWSISLNLEAVK